MHDGWRKRHDRRGWGWDARGRRKPPWWPENETWPPQDAAAWRELRRGFVRRAGCFLVFVIIVLFLAFGAVTGLISAVAGWAYALVSSLVLVIVFGLIIGRIVRAFRSSAAPVGDLVEAAGRMEAGELDVQVPEQGMREVRGLTRAFNAMSTRVSATERERRRLLAELSHELRTPLTVIQGNVEAMIDGIYPADREHLERIQAETRQLARLIEDLRTLSLAETGQLRLQREPTALRLLVQEVVSGFEAEAANGGVELKTETADNLPDADVDPFRLRQVLANLVSNALRHTPSGGRVTVSVRRPPGEFVLGVEDTGAGMTPDAVEHAFERFWRSGESAGAGLGLAIVRDLVTAHGGTIELKSRVGEGTAVTFHIPA